ncbi:hypothetical protein MHM98_07710 [Psychrobium sp. MM17-31]|uniref:hypothetical protein n=1 Tax=Psychrobium sp. MM17-31 TaxID=2917758 RepID=UPI001EF43E53|nr:hypothetical protein [Psychrobium sp. MM17-31]MCG7531238.1 hypothetical protein [Psychrobium sp. MM17-31]
MRSFLLTIFLFTSLASNAEVTKQTANGFEITNSVKVSADTSQSYQQFLKVGQWWHDSHTYSGKAANMTLDIESGCFCERWDNNIVRHMNIVMAQPNKQQVWRGGLGPLQTLAASGALIWQFKAVDNKTTAISYTYKVHGDIGDVKMWSKAVDGVLTQQLTRLQERIQK